MRKLNGYVLPEMAIATLITMLIVVPFYIFLHRSDYPSEQVITKAQSLVHDKIDGKNLDEIKRMDCTEDFEVNIFSDRNVYLTIYMNSNSPVTFRAFEENGIVKLTHTNLEKKR